MTASVPLFVLDYPEAHAAADFLKSTRGAHIETTLPANGDLPITDQMVPPDFPNGPFIVVNGSSDFHHETANLFEGFLKNLGEDEKVLYAQVDAHPDKDDTFRWKIDCASFVGKVMEHKRVERAMLLGLNPACMDTPNFGYLVIGRVRYFRCDYFQKLHQYPMDNEIREVLFDFWDSTIDDAKANESVNEVELIEMAHPAKVNMPASLYEGSERALRVQWKTLADFDPTGLPDLPLYLTIDLDVLRSALVTDWRHDPEPDKDVHPWGYGDNQGVMELDTLIELIGRLGRARKIRGADFCGLTRHFHEIHDDAKAMSLECIGKVYDALVEVMK